MEEQKRARMAGQSSSMADLPSPILIDIISRFPIKTVMAVSCVCKSLLSVVSDSHFQTLYSTRAPTELLVSCTHISSATLCFAECVLVEDSLADVKGESNIVFELPNFSVRSDNYCNFGATKTTVSFVNSCCGLVCFRGPYRSRFAVICNPFTREFITFPCPAMMDKNVKRGSINYGLGFSPKDNRFKLLRMMYRKNVDACVGEIYTFGERGSSWKRVANCPNLFYLLQLEKVVFHEGALHWYYNSRDGIVTFDFDTELFGKNVIPPRMCDIRSSDVSWASGLCVFENCLCVSSCVGDCVDIWALKEYGQDSWIKIFSIQEDVQSFGDSYEPFKYLQNGKVLMLRRFGGIVCFSPDTGSVKHVGGIVCFSPYTGCANGAVFIKPSLVSLKVLLGDNVNVHSVKPRDLKKAATVPRWWTSSVAVKDVVKADKDSQLCVPGSSAPRSSSKASASTSHPTEEKVKEDVLPAILASQQGGSDVGSFGSQDPRLPKDRLVDQSSSGTQKLASEIETLKVENDRKGKEIELLNAENDRQGKAIDTLTADNERQGKAIETLNAENDRQGKAIAKLKQGKKEDRVFMRFMYKQMLNVNPNMPPCPMPRDSSSFDDSN